MTDRARPGSGTGSGAQFRPSEEVVGPPAGIRGLPGWSPQSVKLRADPLSDLYILEIPDALARRWEASQDGTTLGYLLYRRRQDLGGCLEVAILSEAELSSHRDPQYADWRGYVRAATAPMSCVFSHTEQTVRILRRDAAHHHEQQVLEDTDICADESQRVLEIDPKELLTDQCIIEGQVSMQGVLTAAGVRAGHTPPQITLLASGSVPAAELAHMDTANAGQPSAGMPGSARSARVATRARDAQRPSYARELRVRMQTDELRRRIRSLFSQAAATGTTYLTFHELNASLAQPDQFLRIVLDKICDQAHSGVHKNKYHLKHHLM